MGSNERSTALRTSRRRQYYVSVSRKPILTPSPLRRLEARLPNSSLSLAPSPNVRITGLFTALSCQCSTIFFSPLGTVNEKTSYTLISDNS